MGSYGGGSVLEARRQTYIQRRAKVAPGADVHQRRLLPAKHAAD
jgi:hypothetical protein